MIHTDAELAAMEYRIERAHTAKALRPLARQLLAEVRTLRAMLTAANECHAAGPPRPEP